MRTILSFVLAVFVTVFLWATIISQPAGAQGATANWDGAALSYDGKQFTDGGKAARNQFPGISQDAPYFIASTTPATGANSAPRDVFIIYFSPGVDPPAATSGQFVKFRYDPTTRTYSNPSDQTTISLQGTPGQNATTCAIEGVGWMVCQISSFLATGMDWIFTAISGFMEVQPLTTGQDSGLYVGWNVMRNIANVAFIIVFLIIVYGQLSGAYAGTYGIKKLLPRLVIAAVLVNMSYIICALAVDLSNILGYSLQNIFIEIRNQIFNIDSETWNTEYMLSWESITGFVLSGGTAALGASIGVFSAVAATGGTVMGAIYLLLPVLLGLIVAILVVLLILAARQAIITVLIFIAPLAFVAYLLPNTEKWFDKWRGLFMTMLIFFPAFSVLFGGSQLAGAIIVQNASSINILILGMIVQVAPLVITPFLLKFSGSLLGRIAGLVNNPNKGLIDRTRKFSESRAAMHRNRGISGQGRNGAPGELKKRNVARRASRWANSLSSNFEGRAKNAQAAADNAYHESNGYMKNHNNAALIAEEKGAIDAHHAAHDDTLRATAGTALNQQALLLATEKQNAEDKKNQASLAVENLRADNTSGLHINSVATKASEGALERATSKSARLMTEYKAGEVATTNTDLNQYMASMVEDSIQNNAEKQGAVSAQYELQKKIAGAMTSKDVSRAALKKIAGGVGGRAGELRAVAASSAELQKLESEAIKNIQDTADIRPGKLEEDAVGGLLEAIRVGDDISARAYQNILLKAGGAGIDEFRKAVTQLSDRIPTDLQTKLQENIISTHPDVKAKGNDIMEWAVLGGRLGDQTEKAGTWTGLSVKDFIGQHPKAQAHAIRINAFDETRVKKIIAADNTAGGVLSDDIRKELLGSVGLPKDYGTVTS